MKQLSDYNFFDPEVLRCPYEFYNLARDQEPVMKLPGQTNDIPLFLITRYDLVMEVLKNEEIFSSNFNFLLSGKNEQDPALQKIRAQGWPPVNTLLTADPPEHERFRGLVNKAFTASRVNKMTDSIKLIADELIDAFVEERKCEFFSQFAVPMPIKVIADQLGVSRKDLSKFKQWSDAAIALLGHMLTKEEEISCAQEIVDFQHYFHNIIEQRRQHPQDDLISDLVQAEIEGEALLNTAELLSILQQLLVAGNETISNAITGGLVYLIQNPTEMLKVQEEPNNIENLVEEVLRMMSPTAGMWRIVKQNTELEGVSLTAGSLVMIRFDAANRDPLQYGSGEQFDVCRKNAGSHLAFGHGIHFCLGAMLARKEMQIAYEQLLSRIKNIQFSPGRDDPQPIPNILLRVIPHLHIEFEIVP